jgi:restriction system protein
MARRKQKHVIDPGTALGLLMGAGAIWLVLQNIQRIGFLILACCATALVYLVMRHLWRMDARRTLLQKAHDAIESQKGSLVRKRAQLVWPDAYGKPQMEKWEKEKDYFITQQIRPSLTSQELRALERDRTIISNLIELHVEEVAQSQPALIEFSDEMTPAEFEAFCATELCRAGWNARVTKQGRDQGIDIVAEKGDVRVVVQCKLYFARPVGNKSVQEAAAAKAHEQANYGIVVTNSRFTTAAEQLASTNGVLLLHYSDLQNLRHLLGTGR